MPTAFISYNRSDHKFAAAAKTIIENCGLPASEVYLDLDPEGGNRTGEEWIKQAKAAMESSEIAVFLVSNSWLDSAICRQEYDWADKLPTVSGAPRTLHVLLINIEPQELPPELMVSHAVSFVEEEHNNIGEQVAIRLESGQQSTVRVVSSALKKFRRGINTNLRKHFAPQWPKDSNEEFGLRFPYRGLAALTERDHRVFFGRDTYLNRFFRKVDSFFQNDQPTAIIIIGASGAGKSSFLQAGVIPRLKRQAQPLYSLPIIRSGHECALDSETGLAQAMTSAWNKWSSNRISLADMRQAVKSPETFTSTVHALLDQIRERYDSNGSPKIMVPIDQAEELFSESMKSTATQFFEILRPALDDRSILFAATIRADAYEPLLRCVPLDGVHQDALSLPPLSHGELGRVITEPARLYKQELPKDAWSPLISPELSEVLQKELLGEPDALPLLAYVLEKLMREHEAEEQVLTDHLRELGGIKAVINDAAEKVLDDVKVPKETSRRMLIVQNLFIPRLARIDRASRKPLRRSAALSSFSQGDQEILSAFIEARLIVSRQDREKTVVEVAHEAMLRDWSVLRKALDNNVRRLLDLESAIQAAKAWRDASLQGKDDFLIHRGANLVALQSLVSDSGAYWRSEIDKISDYLAACKNIERETLSRLETRVQGLFAREAQSSFVQEKYGEALRIALMGWPTPLQQSQGVEILPALEARLAQSRQALTPSCTWIKAHNTPVTSLAFDDYNGDLFSGDEDGVVLKHRIVENTFDEHSIIDQLRVEGSVSSIHISNRKRKLVVGTDLGEISMVDLRRSRSASRRSFLSAPISAIFVDEFSDLLWLGYATGEVLCVPCKDWAHADAKTVWSREERDWTDSVVEISADVHGSVIIVTGSGRVLECNKSDNCISDWFIDVPRVRSARMIQNNGGAAISYYDNGSAPRLRFAISSEKGFELLPPLESIGEVTSLEITGDNRRILAVTGGLFDQNEALIFDSTYHWMLARYTLPAGGNSITCRSDQKVAAIALDSGEIGLWSIKWVASREFLGNDLVSEVIEDTESRHLRLLSHERSRISEFATDAGIGFDIADRFSGLKQ